MNIKVYPDFAPDFEDHINLASFNLKTGEPLLFPDLHYRPYGTRALLAIFDHLVTERQTRGGDTEEFVAQRAFHINAYLREILMGYKVPDLEVREASEQEIKILSASPYTGDKINFKLIEMVSKYPERLQEYLDSERRLEQIKREEGKAISSPKEKSLSYIATKLKTLLGKIR